MSKVRLAFVKKLSTELLVEAIPAIGRSRQSGTCGELVSSYVVALVEVTHPEAQHPMQQTVFQLRLNA
jgi:hypothetical protein